jgi:uncharacterized membrane protein YhdT
MYRNEQPVSVGSYMAMLLVVVSALALEQGLVSDPQWYWLLWITIPLLLVCIFIINR